MNKKTLKEIKELYCNVLSETLSKSEIDKKIIEKVMDLSGSGRIVDPDGNDLNLDDDFKYSCGIRSSEPCKSTFGVILSSFRKKPLSKSQNIGQES